MYECGIAFHRDIKLYNYWCTYVFQTLRVGKFFFYFWIAELCYESGDVRHVWPLAISHYIGRSLSIKIIVSPRSLPFRGIENPSDKQQQQVLDTKMAGSARGTVADTEKFCIMWPLNSLAAVVVSIRTGTRWYRGANICATVLIRILFRLPRSIALLNKYGMERLEMVMYGESVRLRDTL